MHHICLEVDDIDAMLAQVAAKGLGARNLSAKIAGKVVTLTGECPGLEAKTKIMEAFNALVETENTINLIKVPAPAAAPAAAPVKVEASPAPAAGKVYEVVAGDTLSGIAKKFYGKASLYMKIFEANKDQLSNPDRIKVGQKLRIPN